MNISEQVKELRNLANYFQRQNRDYYTAPTLREAADTIEALSVKLQAENSSRWITDKEPEESGYYDVTVEAEINDEIVYVTENRCFHKDTGLWAQIDEPEFDIKEKVVAWKNKQVPYNPHEMR